MTVTRRLAYARTTASGAEERLSLGGVRNGDDHVLEDWPDGFEALADRARAAHAALSDRLPPSRRAGLGVEAGLTEVEGVGRGTWRRAYLAAFCDLTPLLCVSAGTPPPVPPGTDWRDDWSAAPPGSAAVILGASTVMTLALHLADAGRAGREALDAAPGLRLRFGRASPYPPHHHPWTDGAGVGRDEADAVEPLLGRLDAWAAPLTSIYGGRRGHLAVTDRRRPRAAPPGHVLLEGLEAWSAPTTDVSNWRAAWSVVDAGGVRHAGTPDLRLRASAATLLAQTQGPVGRPRPACRRDPIEGAAWGWARPLATSLRLEALL